MGASKLVALLRACCSSPMAPPVITCDASSRGVDERPLVQEDGTTAAFRDTYGNEFHLPEVTMKEVFDAIPAHCYKRDTLRSLAYVARDIFLVACLGLAASYINLIPFFWLRVLAWTVYGFLQGLTFTGLWVLAHECGHGAFSASKSVCDTVGWVLHSALFVPYFSWKFSHSEHHKHTGHMDSDTVFVPKTHSDRGNRIFTDGFFRLVEDTPIYTAGRMLSKQLFGWPLYLLINVTGHRYDHPRWKLNHFLPTAPIFEEKHFNSIVLSDIGIGLAAVALGVGVRAFGWATVALFYVVPYLWCNHWLVLITYLQHTDPTLPHYRGGAWTFTRGALATIDRDFGFIGRHIFHRIIETHVAHHLCSRIPFYNADDATMAIKKILGKNYRCDKTNIFVAWWRSARECHSVADSGDVVFFQNGTKKLKRI